MYISYCIITFSVINVYLMIFIKQSNCKLNPSP